MSVCPVMKSLNSPQEYWQVDRANTEVKIHKLQEELERVTLENRRLLERSPVSGERAGEEGIFDKIKKELERETGKRCWGKVTLGNCSGRNSSEEDGWVDELQLVTAEKFISERLRDMFMGGGR